MKFFLFSLLLSALTFNCSLHAASSDSALKATEQTLSIIKPDAVADHNVGAIISRFEKNGLHVAALRMVLLTKEKAQAFYAVHKERPFFNALTDFMSSGPSVVMVLEGNNAVAKNRELMGATDPKNALPGTIRADFAHSNTANAVHGSDSLENAKNEIAFFFSSDEIFSR